MSRIQEILAKAERDGTARRTQTETLAPAPPVACTPTTSPVPRTDGSSALDTCPSHGAVGSGMPVAVAPAMPSLAAVAAQATTAVEPRTAVATLHPLLIAAINPHSPAAE